MWTCRDKKLLHIPGFLGNSLINISVWWEAVKGQGKAAQSIFKFNKRIANVAIATTDLFQACHTWSGTSCKILTFVLIMQISSTGLWKGHLVWQACTFFFLNQSSWVSQKCKITVSCNETCLGNQCKVVLERGTAAGLEMLSMGAMKTNSFKMQAGVFCRSLKRLV